MFLFWGVLWLSKVGDSGKCWDRQKEKSRQKLMQNYLLELTFDWLPLFFVSLPVVEIFLKFWIFFHTFSFLASVSAQWAQIRRDRNKSCFFFKACLPNGKNQTVKRRRNIFLLSLSLSPSSIDVSTLFRFVARKKENGSIDASPSLNGNRSFSFWVLFFCWGKKKSEAGRSRIRMNGQKKRTSQSLTEKSEKSETLKKGFFHFLRELVV